MDLGLAKKVAIVAGGARGCGRGITEALAVEGAHVLFTSRNEEVAKRTETELRQKGCTVTGLVMDMGTEEGTKAIVETTRQVYGEADILVTNPPNPIPGAGGRGRGFENCDDMLFTETFDAHVISVVRLTRLVLPAMKANRWGRLLNIGTIAFKTPHQEFPLPAQDVRIAVAPLQRILAHEFGAFGITSNIIATGPFESELLQAYMKTSGNKRTKEWYLERVPIGRLGQPLEMGWLAAFLCSERAGYLIGEVIRLDGGYTKSLF